MPRVHSHTLTPTPVFALVLPPAPSKARSLQQTHRCRLRLVLRGAVPVLSPSEGLSPHTHSGKAITFTPIAGEKLELINLAAGKRSMIYCLIIALVDFPVTSSQELCPCLSPPKGHPQDTAQCSADTAEKTVDSISSDTSGTLEARTAAPQLTARAVPGSTGLAGAPRTTGGAVPERASSALCLHPARTPSPPEMGGPGGKCFAHLPHWDRGGFALCLHEVLLFLSPILPHGAEYCSPFIKEMLLFSTHGLN